MLVIGIAGGSGAGKTTIATAILETVGGERVGLLQQDSYYRDGGNLSPDKRAQINYDHPDSLETELLISHLKAMRQGRAVEVPRYDFTSHRRIDRTTHLEPPPVLLVEGILVLANAELRSLMDLKIYVDTDADLRLARRLERDIRDRYRTPDSVLAQYRRTIRPMHLQFVEPSKRHAEIIISEGCSDGAVSTVIRCVSDHLKGS